MLLKYNPVHKKMPVLVHNGKPIAESAVILEYIEETSPQHPLLPKDPYERGHGTVLDQLPRRQGSSIRDILHWGWGGTEEGSREELLKIYEEQALGEKKYFGDEEIGMLDLAMGWMAVCFGIIEEIVDVKILDAKTFPPLHAWVQNFRAHPVIKKQPS